MNMRLNDVSPVAMGLAAAGAAFAAWAWWRMNVDVWDDDDEVYYACFKPSASPVATPHAFAKILQRLPPKSRVLDVGIGSGTYLEHDAVRKIMRERSLHVDGVDISAPNVDICKERITKHGLNDCFTATTIDARKIDADGKYDAVLFMESFPVMPASLFVDILQNVQRLLKPTGQNYLYHNLCDPTTTSSAVVMLGKIVKPAVRIFVGIDFGRLTTTTEMAEYLASALPEASKKTADEILLSCSSTEFHCDFSGVSNLFHRFWCVLSKTLMKFSTYQVEQHLIVLPKGAKVLN